MWAYLWSVPLSILRDTLSGLTASLFGVFRRRSSSAEPYARLASRDCSTSPTTAAAAVVTPTTAAKAAATCTWLESCRIKYKNNEVYITSAYSMCMLTAIEVASTGLMEQGINYLLSQYNSLLLSGALYDAEVRQSYEWWAWLAVFTCWRLPSFLVLRAASMPLLNDLANTVFKARKGSTQPSTSSCIERFMDCIFFIMLIGGLYVCYTLFTCFVPDCHAKTIARFVLLSIYYSAYSFDYKWYNDNWKSQEKVTYLDRNWAYFMGFGGALASTEMLGLNWLLWILLPWCIVNSHSVGIHAGVTPFPLPVFQILIFLVDLPFAGFITHKFQLKQSHHQSHLNRSWVGDTSQLNATTRASRSISSQHNFNRSLLNETSTRKNRSNSAAFERPAAPSTPKYPKILAQTGRYYSGGTR